MTGLRAHRALEQATPGLKIHLICHQTRGVQHHLILWNPLLIDGIAPTPGRGAVVLGPTQETGQRSLESSFRKYEEKDGVHICCQPA